MSWRKKRRRKDMPLEGYASCRILGAIFIRPPGGTVLYVGGYINPSICICSLCLATTCHWFTPISPRSACSLLVLLLPSLSGSFISPEWEMPFLPASTFPISNLPPALAWRNLHSTPLADPGLRTSFEFSQIIEDCIPPKALYIFGVPLSSTSSLFFTVIFRLA